MTNVTPHASPSITLTDPTGLTPLCRWNCSNPFDYFHRFRICKLDLRGPNRADDVRPIVPGGLFQRFPGVLGAALICLFCLPAIFVMVASNCNLLFLLFLLLFLLLTPLFLFLLFGAFRLRFFFFDIACVF